MQIENTNMVFSENDSNDAQTNNRKSNYHDDINESDDDNKATDFNTA
jgi:hypothetical protein